jgi:hypothetical protein
MRVSSGERDDSSRVARGRDLQDDPAVCFFDMGDASRKRWFLVILLAAVAASGARQVIAAPSVAQGLNNAASFMAAYRLRSERELQAAYSFEGTAWFGEDAGSDTTFRFEKNGLLRYSYRGHEYTNGTWKRDGNAVYFEMNQKYREFKGNLKEGRIEGDSWNVAGSTWKTVMKRRLRETGK